MSNYPINVIYEGKGLDLPNGGSQVRNTLHAFSIEACLLLFTSPVWFAGYYTRAGFTLFAPER